VANGIVGTVALLYGSKLYFSGPQTATSHPGYLEGAVTVTKRTAPNVFGTPFFHGK